MVAYISRHSERNSRHGASNSVSNGHISTDGHARLLGSAPVSSDRRDLHLVLPLRTSTLGSRGVSLTKSPMTTTPTRPPQRGVSSSLPAPACDSMDSGTGVAAQPPPDRGLPSSDGHAQQRCPRSLRPALTWVPPTANYSKKLQETLGTSDTTNLICSSNFWV
jgi:hypothetical protein